MSKSKKQKKEERVPCPFCKERIIKGAKKCRFCREMLAPEEKKHKKSNFLHSKISPRLFYWIWLASCVVFMVALSILPANGALEYSSRFTTTLAGSLILAVLVGGAAFIGLVIAILTSLRQKRSRWYGVVTASTLLIFFSIFFGQFTQNNQQKQNPLQEPLGPSEIIEVVNQEREKNNLSNLNHSPTLSSAAKAYAQDMCHNNYYISETADFSKKYVGFIEDAGYEHQLAAFTVNEDVYDSRVLTQQWLQNSETKEVLLSDNYTETGVGIVRCGLKALGKTTDVIVQFYALPKAASSKQQYSLPAKQNTQTNSQPSLIDCTGPDGVVFKATEQECLDFNAAWGVTPTADPNEIIRCNIHPNCGGGYKEMTRASCEEMVCCSLWSNEPPVFISKDECQRRNHNTCSSQVLDSFHKDMDHCSKSYTGSEHAECLDRAEEAKNAMLNICP